MPKSTATIQSHHSTPNWSADLCPGPIAVRMSCIHTCNAQNNQINSAEVYDETGTFHAKEFKNKTIDQSINQSIDHLNTIPVSWKDDQEVQIPQNDEPVNLRWRKFPWFIIIEEYRWINSPIWSILPPTPGKPRRPERWTCRRRNSTAFPEYADAPTFESVRRSTWRPCESARRAWSLRGEQGSEKEDKNTVNQSINRTIVRISQIIRLRLSVASA